LKVEAIILEILAFKERIEIKHGLSNKLWFTQSSGSPLSFSYSVVVCTILVFVFKRVLAVMCILHLVEKFDANFSPERPGEIVIISAMHEINKKRDMGTLART